MKFLLLIASAFVLLGATMYTPGGPQLPTTITLSCSTTPSLSGTYNVDEYMLTTLNSEMLYYISNGSVFPSVTQVPGIADTSGTVHLFATIAQLQTFYKAVAGLWIGVANYQNRLNAGQSPTYPSNTSSAC